MRAIFGKRLAEKSIMPAALSLVLGRVYDTFKSEIDSPGGYLNARVRRGGGGYVIGGYLIKLLWLQMANDPIKNP